MEKHFFIAVMGNTAKQSKKPKHTKMRLKQNKPDKFRLCNAAVAGSKPGKCRGQKKG